MVTNKMWGGRFAGGPASIMEVITPSIDFDKRLAVQDIAGSKAHARMLAVQQIIPMADRQGVANIVGERRISRFELLPARSHFEPPPENAS